ncbi:MAG: Uma2 family endonuclease [Microcoleus sp. PH2017_13_LAR_U_A]|uniref:Uma2 family endonuclease n=1 Tax=Microcoleus sp. PH2017_13_LAR_U_A TaxID=2798824 RepID=UPI001DDF14AC|nr:Uma2 family endonuclease [Microcoleus sp. PH2017_13_LAR_U_A]MCC3470229.1 Uma2 family endonuclease [Microcoleus sp. PH2017_13_LAR_U_A]
MVVAAKSTISLAEFLQLPETKPASEYIDGQIYQKPMPQGKHSRLQKRLLEAISEVGEPQKLACAFPELRCTFGGRSIVPDIAVFECANRFEIPPDWIIEILSPDQSPNQVIKKIIFSINHGTKLGWFADPSDKSVIVFQPNQLPEVKSDTDILPVLSVLGDWQLSAAELFNWLKIN